MAQLYFYYSAMNAGKSTTLLQSSYNYQERGMKTLIYTASFDDRFGLGKVSSRLGISAEAELFTSETDLYQQMVTFQQQHQQSNSAKSKVDCLLIDEAQFLTKEQVKQLTNVVDELNIPVLTYGIRTDFQGEPFSGSNYLLAWADKLVELKTVCHCGRKANFVVRFDEHGNAVKQGAQVDVGGNEKYESMCRIHFKALVWN